MDDRKADQGNRSWSRRYQRDKSSPVRDSAAICCASPPLRRHGVRGASTDSPAQCANRTTGRRRSGAIQGLQRRSCCLPPARRSGKPFKGRKTAFCEGGPLIRWHAVAPDPRPDGVDRYAASERHFFGPTSGSYDVGVRRHGVMMHDALQDVKCQMHHEGDYSPAMLSPADRLKQARTDAGYQNAKQAARIMAVKPD